MNVEVVELAGLGVGGAVRFLTTLEGENPSGSIKDRMVSGELASLGLSPGSVVSEASAGSTARSLAWFARELGLVAEIFVPDSMDAADLAVLEELGARVHAVPRRRGYELYNEFVERERPHCLNQLSDHSLLRHYHALGAAIGPVDAVLGAVGTGHSLLGVAEGAGPPRPFTATAEPDAADAVAGIRNIEFERYGDQDACTPDLFDCRLVVPGPFAPGTVETDRGVVEYGASFAVVLAAVPRLLEQRPGLSTVFLVGASLRRSEPR